MKKIAFLLFIMVFAFNYLLQAQTKNINEDQKYVIIEEMTGTWCTYCPKGTVKGRQLSQDYDNVIMVVIHTSDPMAYPVYADATGLTAAPSANINRKHMGQDTQSWESMVNQETAIAPPAYITVSTNYNESTRELEAIVSAEFIEDFTGNLRLAGLVLEDAVTGQSGYDQSNSYSGGGSGPMGGFETLPSPVPSNMIAYDHVSRELLGTYNGVEGSIPASVSSGETHSYTFNYTLPEEYNHEYIRIAAWLINDDNGQILNAGKSQFILGYENAKPHFISEAVTTGNVDILYNYQLYVADPETDDLVISAIGLPDWLTLVETAQHTVHTAGLLSGIPTETGTFPITLTVTDGDWTTEQSFDLVIAANPGAGWEVIGEEGFSNFDVSQTTLKLDADGNPFVAYHNWATPIQVMNFDGTSWNQLGGDVGTADSDMAMDIDSDGNPWVAYNDIDLGIKTIVKKYNGSSWENVGAPVSVGTGRSIDLTFDNNGIAYVAFYEQEQGILGYIYKYENNNWIQVGSGPIDEGGALLFKLAFDSQNNPYLLWATTPSGYQFYSRVSKYENNEWSLVGSGNLSSDLTYYQHSITIDENDQVSVAVCESTSTNINVYQYNGFTWDNITSTDNFVGEYLDLVSNSQGDLYLGFPNALQGSQTSVMKYDGNAWESVGPIIISGVSSYHEMDINSNDEPYIAYVDDSFGEKATVKAYLSSEYAIININSSSIVFPDTYIGQTAEETISISNSGNITLEVSDISSDNEAFTVNLNELTLEPGESQELIIEFSPLLVQEYNGIISIQSNDSQQESIEIEVSGNGDLNIGILEQNADSYTIYPQPANDFITVLSKDIIKTITIYNLNGQEVLRTNAGSVKNQINLSELNTGIYMIQIEIGTEKYFEKLIIQ